MGTVHVSIGDVNSRGDTGASMPVRKSVAKASETLTSSASNARSTITAGEADNDFWRIVARDVDVWVAFGASADATSGTRELLLAGSVLEVSATVAGEKVAVVNA